MNALARWFAAVAVLALAGCGGAMQAGVGSGGSGAPLSVGVGPVTGFGSIIVNGERYDESAAEVLVDERPDRATAATIAAIRLGMHVELQHRDLVVTTALVSAELVGPVSSVSASGFVALGQIVQVDADPARRTVFEGFGTLADLASGSVVEVHGDRAPTGEILATRVELKPAGLALVRIAGTASSVNGRSFSIGALIIDASSASLVPAGATIADGERVVAWTDAPYTGGTLAAKVVRVGAPTIATNAAVALDGVVGAFRSPSSFRVSGIPVNAGGSTLFAGGSAADLRNGVPLRVRGTFTGSEVNATSVEFLQASHATVHLTGPISDFVDAGSAFRIRNALTRVTPQTTYVGGVVANLGTGAMVKLTGSLVSGAVQATTIEFLPVMAGGTRIVFGSIGAPLGAVAADGTRTFRLDGHAFEVKTSGATSYRNGGAADVAVGRQIKVKGSLPGAQFIADEVQFMDNSTSPPTIEISGIASKVQPASFEVNGQVLQLTGATVYTVGGAPGAFANLTNGSTVDVVASGTAGALTALTVNIR